MSEQHVMRLDLGEEVEREVQVLRVAVSHRRRMDLWVSA